VVLTSAGLDMSTWLDDAVARPSWRLRRISGPFVSRHKTAR